MHSLHLDLARALEWISELHDIVVEKFLLAFTQVPHYSDPDLDRQVTQFIHGIGNWVIPATLPHTLAQQYFDRSVLTRFGHLRSVVHICLPGVIILIVDTE
jgi:hypothetical protein